MRLVSVMLDWFLIVRMMTAVLNLGLGMGLRIVKIRLMAVI
jgi:hypothetical protein